MDAAPKSLRRWINSAIELLADIPAYAKDMSVEWDAKEAELAATTRDHEQLYNLLQTLWETLPDLPHIHTGPFDRLCDLCSAYGIVSDGKELTTGETDEERLVSAQKKLDGAKAKRGLTVALFAQGNDNG